MKVGDQYEVMIIRRNCSPVGQEATVFIYSLPEIADNHRDAIAIKMIHD